MKTYTFAGGTISSGFILTDTEEHGKVLFLGEGGPGSWLTRVPLNNNLDNRPIVENNVVLDGFLLNVGQEKDFFVLAKDRSQANGCHLVRFLTVGKGDKGNGYVNRITGWRSKELTSGHGRNHAVLSNGTWSDSVWVLYEGELVQVQLAGGGPAFAVRVKNGMPTVEPWFERQPRQEKPKDKPVELVSGNGNVGRHGGNPHRMRTLTGSHVVAEPVRNIPIKEWIPGLNDSPEPKINLDQELAKLGKNRVANFRAKYQRQSVTA